jgi:hypothetical protein
MSGWRIGAANFGGRAPAKRQGQGKGLLRLGPCRSISSHRVNPVIAGSVFWFELNSSAEPRLETDRAQTAIVEVPVRHGAPVRSTLLYVEDNPANLTSCMGSSRSRSCDGALGNRPVGALPAE